MNKIKAIILIILLFTVLTSTGCTNPQEKKQQDYQKCTEVCASVLTTEDYIILHLCNEECKQSFLNSS